MSPTDSPPHPSPETPGPAELLALAVEIAAAAAELLLEGRGRLRAVVETKSTLTDMVTEMDRASEALIAGALRARRPGDGLVGEEGTADDGTTGVRWVFDPLDGTTNYLYGIPAYAVAIAAEVDGVAVAGVVHDVGRGEVFTATRGGGAWLDGTRLAVTGSPDLSTALCSTGFAYARERRARQAAVLTHVLPEIRDIRRAGAAAIDLCWVAAGRVDAMFELGLAPWDHAAGALIAQEAGALVGTLDGGDPIDDIIIAAPPHLDAPLRALLSHAVTASP